MNQPPNGLHGIPDSVANIAVRNGNLPWPPCPEHVVEKMPYDWRIHAHMTRLKMGARNFDRTGALAVGDHVTDQFGGPGP